jgi:hypothetical protein
VGSPEGGTFPIEDLNALEDASPRARLSAVRALGTIGPDAKPALDDLTKAEKDIDISVKQMATAALAQIKTQIELNSKWDGILRVESAQGAVLAQKAEPARLTFVAPADGWYRVVITSFTPQTSGQYSLRVKNVE